MKKILILALVIATFGLVACTEGGNNEEQNLDQLAQCLTEKGVVMYGAYWCGHCNNQKLAFGDSWQYITYQECDPAGENGNREACLEAGVKAYPTWVFPGQENFVGEQPIEALAKAANCDEFLPSEEDVTEA